VQAKTCCIARFPRDSMAFLYQCCLQCNIIIITITITIIITIIIEMVHKVQHEIKELTDRQT